MGVFFILTGTQAGCIAGATQTIVTSPAELVKVRMQAPGSKFSSSAQCLMSSVRENGIRAGLFKGFGVTFLRDCPNIGIYFLSYEWCKQVLHPASGKLFLGNVQLGDNFAVLLAGGTAGIVSPSRCLHACVCVHMCMNICIFVCMQ